LSAARAITQALHWLSGYVADDWKRKVERHGRTEQLLTCTDADLIVLAST
jgi:hypothetical protein